MSAEYHRGAKEAYKICAKMLQQLSQKSITETRYISLTVVLDMAAQMTNKMAEKAAIKEKDRKL